MAPPDTAGGGQDAPPKRSPLSRLSFGHVVMLTAGVMAVLLNLMLLRSGRQEVMVAVAADDLVVGTRVAPDDLRFVAAPLSGALGDRFVAEAEAGQLVGLVMTRTVAAGLPLLEGDVRPEAAPDAGRAMSVPIDKTHAVGGALQRGDRVDLIGVDDGVATYVAVGVEVLAVPENTGSGFQAAAGSFSVTLAVDDVEAIEIAAALDRGDLHIVRSTGAPEPVVPAGDGVDDETGGGDPG